MTAEGDEARTVNAHGAELRFRRIGQGRPVVLIHPLRMQLEYFDGLASELIDGGLELIAIDLPGHGGSSSPKTDYTATYFTDTVETLLNSLDVRDATVVGESIGGSIALGLAARGERRVAGVVAVNPYDYGHWGGIRRSSTIANLVFTAMLPPGVGPIVAHAGTKRVLRRVLAGGFHDPTCLAPELVDQLHRSGSRSGHAYALRSLTRNWSTWIAARTRYGDITMPVTLAYGSDDWSQETERDANARAIPGVHAATLEGCGHFASLERPADVARLIRAAAVPPAPSTTPTSNG